MNLLAGDIGGTKTLLRICRPHGTQFITVREARFESQRYDSFDTLLQSFVQPGEDIDAACFAVAGPVQGTASTQYSRITNLPWKMHSDEIARASGIPVVNLINDFQAIGFGIGALSAEDLVTLQEGEPDPKALRAVLGAGTGLGETFVTWSHGRPRVHGSEGGHIDFAPQDAEQIRLLSFLLPRYGHVSYERLVSGMGLENIYTFYAEENPEKVDPDLKNAMLEGDAAAKIARYAAQGDALARQTMNLFVRIYGAQAGNLALTILPYGGLYVAGGIAAKNLDLMQSGAFMQAFLAKGRMSDLLRKIPVRIITNQEVGLIGAAVKASYLL